MTEKLKLKFRLKRPVDSHAHFYVYVHGALAGDLCVNRNEWEKIVTDKTVVIEIASP